MLDSEFRRQAEPPARPKILLALQGGGSHGAYASGVIKALAEADILSDVVGISGTSAGAYNASCVSYAINAGQPERAPELLDEAWESVKRQGDSIERQFPFALMFMRMMHSVRSPNMPDFMVNQMAEIGNMMGFSQAGALRDTIDDVIPDWDVIRQGHVKTVIGATEVGPKGKLREYNFTNAEIDADAVAASGTLVGTHKKDGRKFKDGAYLKNPPIEGVMPEDEYTDVLLISLNPAPSIVTPGEQFVSDPDEYDFVGPEIYGDLARIGLKGTHNIHAIGMKHEPHWDATSKRNIERSWIENLETKGYEAGKEWVRKHKADLGTRSTFNPVIAPPAPQHNFPAASAEAA